MTNYIFHRDSKWWTFEGELPVKPEQLGNKEHKIARLYGKEKVQKVSE